MSAVAEKANGLVPQSNQHASLGIRGRLMIGFAAIALIFLIAIAITLNSISTIKNYSKELITVELPTYDALLDLSSQIYESQMILRGVLLSSDIKSNNELTRIWTQIENIQLEIDGFTKNWSDNVSLQKWQDLKLLIIQLKSAQEKVLTAGMGGDKTKAINILNSETGPLMTKITMQLNPVSSVEKNTGILDTFSKKLHSEARDVIDGLNKIQIIEYILSIVGILAAVFVALFTARAITRHINIFREHSSRIASGDLRQSVVIESYDEIGQLGNDLNTMTISLAAMTREIAQACQNMVATIDEVQHAVDAQSAGASEQASSINEITASLSEIEKSSAQTMEKSKSLGEAAEQTREKGQLGLEAVDQSVNGMKAVREKVEMIAQTILDLSNKTQQIGEITSVVNNLAQQSKMLALNASIEAAKAGEAGKGFAVVAVEVKTLAEQSEQATAQVQKILEDIRHAAEKAVMVTEEGTKEVDFGTSQVEKTGQIIRNLNDVIHEATIASQQIESAVRQESAGIEQITAGMSEINQVTSSFVVSVKQTTEAISNLATISKTLKTYVDAYKI